MLVATVAFLHLPWRQTRNSKWTAINPEAAFAPEDAFVRVVVKSVHGTPDMHLFLDGWCAAKLTNNSIPTVRTPAKHFHNTATHKLLLERALSPLFSPYPSIYTASPPPWETCHFLLAAFPEIAPEPSQALQCKILPKQWIEYPVPTLKPLLVALAWAWVRSFYHTRST